MNALEASTTFTINELLLGGIALACVVAGLFFWRFWRTSRDRFFLLFAISFWVEAANRIHMGLTAFRGYRWDSRRRRRLARSERGTG